MSQRGFECRQCGYCCLTLRDACRNTVADEDIERWLEEGRDDILKWVNVLPMGSGRFVHDVWIDPATGEEVDRCPWLVKDEATGRYGCSIHGLAPAYCDEYPESREHAERTGCKGYEPVKA